MIAGVVLAPAPASWGDDLLRPGSLRLGVGDRMMVKTRGSWTSEPANALAQGLDIDLFQVWLPLTPYTSLVYHMFSIAATTPHASQDSHTDDTL